MHPCIGPSAVVSLRGKELDTVTAGRQSSWRPPPYSSATTEDGYPRKLRFQSISDRNKAPSRHSSHGLMLVACSGPEEALTPHGAVIPSRTGAN
jgi:hypothetical protein